jgi:hypothetical protein
MGYVATGGSSAVAQVLSLWPNLKTYTRAAVGWIGNTATIGNFVRLGSIGLAGLIVWLIVQDLMRRHHRTYLGARGAGRERL